MEIANMFTSNVTRRSLVVGAALVAFACWNTSPRVFRERLTLTVDTPEGEASGSSVTEHETRFQDGWLGAIAHHSLVGGMRGEATFVDLGARGVLFALLISDKTRKKSDGPGGYEYDVFNDLYEQAKRQAGGNSDKRIVLFVDALNRLKPKGDVPIENLGLLVRFGDPNDPRSVEHVAPDNLSASFGPGVRLARATIEIVDEPLTMGIEKELPWLVGGHDATQLFPENNGRPMIEIPPIQLLTHGEFWRLMQ